MTGSDRRTRRWRITRGTRRMTGSDRRTRRWRITNTMTPLILYLWRTWGVTWIINWKVWKWHMSGRIGGRIHKSGRSRNWLTGWIPVEKVPFIKVSSF